MAVWSPRADAPTGWRSKVALLYTPEAKLGSPCPEFTLPAVGGGTLTPQQARDTKGLLVMFICNHCPYVKAIEDRLITLVPELRALGIGTLAISSNDAVAHPEDSFEEMARRAAEKRYPFSYLYDESQQIARAFGAVCTPDFFLYDKDLRLAYRGRLDDAWKDPARVRRRELLEAARLIARGEAAPADQVPSMGCSMKWKDSP